MPWKWKHNCNTGRWQLVLPGNNKWKQKHWLQRSFKSFSGVSSDRYFIDKEHYIYSQRRRERVAGGGGGGVEMERERQTDRNRPTYRQNRRFYELY